MQAAWHVHVSWQVIVMPWNNSEGQRSVISLGHAVQQHNVGRSGQHLVTSPLLLLLMTRF